MKKGFVIKCERQTVNGFIVQFLGKNSVWYSACNDCEHKTILAARKFFKTSNHELVGSSIWIEGPKGGRYSWRLK